MTGFELLVCGFLMGALIAFALTQDYYQQRERVERARRQDWR